MKRWVRKRFPSANRRPLQSSRLHFERLEDRSVPATFAVTNLNDAGAGSLRDAIGSANAKAGADTLAISGADSAIIMIANTNASAAVSV